MKKRVVSSLKFLIGTIAFASSVIGILFALTGSENQFWPRLAIGIICGCVFLALIHFFFPSFKEVVKRVNKYPTLLKVHESKLSELDEARRAIDGIPEKIRQAIQTERVETIGDVLASSTAVRPECIRLTAVETTEDGLFFLANVEAGNSPPAGARFLIRTKNFQREKGAVRVVDQRHTTGILLQVTSQLEGTAEFWKKLHMDSQTTETPPDNIELAIDNTRLAYFEGEQIL
ncbi:hypothetical protein [Glutamicibacter sp. NPDC127525]|uniref:hypothetical protein n=1 Tax=unclassified Glutamicibacter TaxID=2627139 RepID=UPI00363000BF